jgi:anti-sigma28 factor (negative regulator of flagellin synthesis)
MKFDFFYRHNTWPSCLQRLSRPAAGCNVKTRRADEVPLSEDGNVVRQARAVFDETPEVRRERVAALRQQVRSGAYEIPISQLLRILAPLLLRRR